MKKKLKFPIIVFIILALFILFLVNIPNMINENSNSFDKVDEIESKKLKTSKIIETTKIKTIAEDVINSMSTLSISDVVDIDYIVNLTVNNKIHSDSNNIGQEIIISYLQNQTAEAKGLSYHFIENSLDKYDTKNDRKWRNQELRLKINDENVVLYKEGQLLIEKENATIKEKANQSIRINEIQKYIFTYDNDTKKELDVNLITGENKERLNDFIDSQSGRANEDIKNIETKMIESDENYVLEFIIWK